MNCYKFEENISEYIDGALKQSLRQDFIAHKTVCESCDMKLRDIQHVIKNLSDLPTFTVSESFNSKLQEKIEAKEQHLNSVWYRITHNGIFGIKPVPALGIAASIALILFASTQLFFGEGGVLQQSELANRIPKIDEQKIQEMYNQNPNLQPMMFAMDMDTSMYDSINSLTQKSPQINNKIQMVNKNY
jgi:hypothetical protein